MNAMTWLAKQLAWEQRLVELRLARPASDDSPASHDNAGRDAEAEPAKAA
jgi:hypothetical protein